MLHYDEGLADLECGLLKENTLSAVEVSHVHCIAHKHQRGIPHQHGGHVRTLLSSCTASTTLTHHTWRREDLLFLYQPKSHDGLNALA